MAEPPPAPESRHDPRVDAYIAARAPFARPILERLRAMVHAADPQAVETMKWSMPFFVHGGRTLCHMAAFKEHAAFGFWRGAAMGIEGDEGAMGQFGRIASIDDLPDEATFAALMATAVAVAEAGGPKPRPSGAARPAIDTPQELLAHFAGDAAAAAAWERFAPSHRRDYATWIEEAKRPETRARRVAQACVWIGEGRHRNWKHERA